MDQPLPSIPAKRYFTIGEVSDLCGVKPHVLRYWEQEFTQLRPMKRRGNRRYYQHHEVLMIRRIRDLLYDQGFTISGARNKLQEIAQGDRDRRRAIDLPEALADLDEVRFQAETEDAYEAEEGGRVLQAAALVEPLRAQAQVQVHSLSPDLSADEAWPRRLQQVRRELAEIRDLLSAALDRSEGSRDSRAII